jgi:hypothetical protein
MAHTMTNHGLYHLLNNAISNSTDIRTLVFKTSAPSVATIRDYNSVADLLGAVTEAAASGYARTALAGLSLVENDATDTITLSASPVTFGAVASGETWYGVAYYIESTNDNTRTLLSVDVPSSTLTTNGGSVTLPTLTYTVTGS